MEGWVGVSKKGINVDDNEKRSYRNGNGNGKSMWVIFFRFLPFFFGFSF